MERKKKKRSVLGILVLVLVLLIALAAGGMATFTLQKLNRVSRVDKSDIEVIDSSQEFFDPDGDEADTISPQTIPWALPSESTQRPTVKNILLIGQDRRPGEIRARSDSMIICTINEETNQITLTSLMRDMYVPFPGDFTDNRINAAYAFGGMVLLDQLIEEDFGIVIDGNVEVDFDGFIEVMDMIAPLEIELKDYEVGYLNNGTNWALHPGVNELNGKQLLRYARTRYVGHGDWERTERQRRVLTAAFNKVRTMRLTEINELANAALPCFTTDLTNKQILNYIYKVVSNRMTIGGTYRLPVEETYTQEWIRGMAVLVPDLEANSKALQEYIYGKD